MSLKLFKASDFSYTPFNNFLEGDLEYLEKNNVIIVDNCNDANIIISQNFKHLKKYFWRTFQNKKFLVWTLEPKFDIHFQKSKKYFFGLVNCHFMNIYTKDVFVSNTSFTVATINKKLEMIPPEFSIKSRKIVTLMSYYKGIKTPALMQNGENIDLIGLRSKIAIEGSKKNAIDVFGKGWPEGISIEDSRDGNWGETKKKILEPYHFNLCFENTAYYNYMTEKIWDSIENYCLPIYYAKNTNAYEIFPENSFIDYSKFNSPQELFNFVANISDEAFIIRMNKCINVYNSISLQGKSLIESERKKTLDKIIEKVHKICYNEKYKS